MDLKRSISMVEEKLTAIEKMIKELQE